MKPAAAAQTNIPDASQTPLSPVKAPSSSLPHAKARSAALRELAARCFFQPHFSFRYRGPCHYQRLPDTPSVQIATLLSSAPPRLPCSVRCAPHAPALPVASHWLRRRMETLPTADDPRSALLRMSAASRCATH